MPARILSDREFDALEELSRVLPLPARRDRPIDPIERTAPATLFAHIGELIAFGRHWPTMALHATPKNRKQHRNCRGCSFHRQAG